MTSLEAPIFIPICNSRSTTPTPIPQEDPETPTTFRQRSDTMMTTSSSSSFPHLQTPETPSILGLLHQQYELPGDFSDDGNGRNRKDSYGFGSIIHSAGESSHEKFSREAGSSEMDTEGSDTEEVEGILSTRSTPFDLGQQYDTNDIPLLTSTTAHPSIIPHFSLAEPIQTALPTGQGFPFPPIESIPLRVEGPVAPEYKRSKSSFKSAVRRKLERSKSSFQALRGRRDEQLNQPLDEDMGEAPGHPGSDAQHLPTALAARPKRGRLRSLLSISMSRSQSSASIRSITSVSSSTTSTSAAVHNGTPSNLSQQMLAIPNDATVVVHEYPGTPSSEEIMSRAIRENRSRAKGLSMQISADDLAGTIDIPLKDKGKSRARSPFRKSKRPNPFSTATGSPMTKMLPDAPGAPLRISRPRAISMPLEASPLGPVFSLRTPTRRKLDLFGTLLPREIQVMVLRKLIEGSGEAVGNGRWDGVAGGRRQLVRFSRVSKSWQSMCLDGQLWPLVHLAPFAPFLHLSTLRRILTAAQPFMTSLSLRGMDNLIGADLIATLAMPGSQLVNLSTIDLRGCKRLTSDEVAILLRAAPHLETVNLKGLQAVSSEVIRTLARTAKSLKSLDVSRCWNISLCDLVVFLKMIAPSQAAGLKVLRLAGIKGYGTTSGEFLPIAAERLVNLETLDLLGCTHLFDSDFHRFAQVLDAQGRVSTLKHLIISGCASLDAATFDHLARRMPELIHLEAAGMPDAYRDRRVDDQSLVNLLRSVPKLERLDLEGTGLYGGVTDRVLDILTPTKGTDGVVGRELVELHVGYAREVTSEALVRLVRGCSNLLVLEADNTAANNALMRDFLRRRPATAQLSLIDCRAITPAAYSALAPSTCPRNGWTGYPSVPFRYSGEMEGKAVLKTFWSWRRVGVPKGWREALADAERGVAPSKGEDTVWGRGVRPGVVRRRGSWWTGEGEEERTNCVVM